MRSKGNVQVLRDAGNDFIPEPCIVLDFIRRRLTESPSLHDSCRVPFPVVSVVGNKSEHLNT